MGDSEVLIVYGDGTRDLEDRINSILKRERWRVVSFVYKGPESGNDYYALLARVSD